MQVGDLVIYMGHIGIVLGVSSASPKHLEVWFTDLSHSIVIYSPLLAKYKKNLTATTLP